jgi:hypothetical protein
MKTWIKWSTIKNKKGIYLGIERVINYDFDYHIRGERL